MKKRILALLLMTLIIFSASIQGFAIPDNSYGYSNLEVLKNLEVEVKQTKEGLVEEGSTEINGVTISFKKIDKLDGTIEIIANEDGEEYIIQIDKSKKLMVVNGEMMDIGKYTNTFSSYQGFEAGDNKGVLSTDWVYRGSWKGSTFVDGLINASLTTIAAAIIGSLPGGVYMSMSIALNLAALWQSAYAGLNILYYTVYHYTDYNPPAPYPYRDKYVYKYYTDSARTNFAFRYIIYL